ncbi:MAG: YicC family protein [Candidatus Zixiibacteriota bacterium]
MISSMTGFGRGEVERDGYRASFEVSSLNSRYLDISIRTPRWMMAMEPELRAVVSARFGRGKIVAQLNWERTAIESSVSINEELVDWYVESIRRVAAKCGLADSLTIGDVLSLPDVWVAKRDPQKDEVVESIVKDALLAALDQLEATRAAEGAKLASSFRQQIGRISAGNDQIKSLAGRQVELYRQRLTQRLDEVLGQANYDEQRLTQEVAFMAERSDITEECVRLGIHCGHFLEALDSAEPVGRRMNFLVQELNREINTIGSKSVDIDISRIVVDLKDELEKIREQVQNIE